MLDSIFKLSYDTKITLKWHFFSMCIYVCKVVMDTLTQSY